jgi:lipoprotein-anchoring transpeptidase ErfK/SrfK
VSARVHGRAAVVGIGLVTGATAAVVVIVAGESAESEPPARPRAIPAERYAAALAIPAPRPLADGPDLTRWAQVRHASAARVRPRPGGRVVAHVSHRTPEGTVTAVPVTGRRRGADGRLWLRITLPVLPNGTSGWVRRRALGAYEVSRHRLVVDSARQRLTLLRRGRVVLRAPVGVGRPRWPTPRGTFLVRNRLERYASPEYGPVAFGTSARSATLTDWPAGGFVGIHGTDRPDLLPGRVSHGCVRLRNPDMLRLARLMPVGTPVVIR